MDYVNGITGREGKKNKRMEGIRGMKIGRGVEEESRLETERIESMLRVINKWMKR